MPYVLIFFTDDKLPDNKKLNTDVWYDEETKSLVKSSF